MTILFCSRWLQKKIQFKLKKASERSEVLQAPKLTLKLSAGSCFDGIAFLVDQRFYDIEIGHSYLLVCLFLLKNELIFSKLLSFLLKN